MKNQIILILALTIMSGCSEKKKEETVETPSVVADVIKPKYLYVSTGVCYSGGNTTFTATTASNISYRLNLTSAQKDLSLADYSALPANPGDSPISVIEVDSTTLMSMVETTAGRRLEKFTKSNNPSRTIFSSNATVLSAALKGIVKTSDGGFLIAKTAGIEKITSQGVRLGAPYIGTNLGATCGAANANINNVAISSSGKIFYTNAVASNNRWGVISPNGYTVAGDCLAVQAAPVATAFPVAIRYIASHSQVLVAYAGNSIAADVNSIYVYDFNETTNAITNPTKIYDANTYIAAGYLLYGISAMVFNPDDNSLYVSTAISNATTVVNYSIEKLTYDPGTKVLSRPLATPFYNYGVDTKCISSLAIAE